jgi:hypothetical protein
MHEQHAAHAALQLATSCSHVSVIAYTQKKYAPAQMLAQIPTQMGPHKLPVKPDANIQEALAAEHAALDSTPRPSVTVAAADASALVIAPSRFTS